MSVSHQSVAGVQAEKGLFPNHAWLAKSHHGTLIFVFAMREDDVDNFSKIQLQLTF